MSGVKTFKFDVAEALKTGYYASGTTGCGKSDVAMNCVDRLRNANPAELLPDYQGLPEIICIIFDPSQDWLERYPIDNVVSFEFASSPRRYIENIELKDSIIIDISPLTIPATQQLADLFCLAIYLQQSRIPKTRRKFYFIVFEEAHTQFPQGILGAKRMANAVRLLTQGRNYNIRMGMITQFAAMLDKRGMRYMKQRYFGWTDELNDRNYISAFIGDEYASSLKYLKSGEFVYYHPSADILETIYIDPYKLRGEKN